MWISWCHNLNSLHCCLCYRWDKHIISVREANVLPKANCWEWRSNFLFVEGDSPFLLSEYFFFSLMVMLSALCRFKLLYTTCGIDLKGQYFTTFLCFNLHYIINCLFLFSEPFDGSNTARAVHEKIKFDAIKAVFDEVFNSTEILTRPLQDLAMHCCFPIDLGLFMKSFREKMAVSAVCSYCVTLYSLGRCCN